MKLRRALLSCVSGSIPASPSLTGGMATDWFAIAKGQKTQIHSKSEAVTRIRRASLHGRAFRDGKADQHNSSHTLLAGVGLCSRHCESRMQSGVMHVLS